MCLEYRCADNPKATSEETFSDLLHFGYSDSQVFILKRIWIPKRLHLSINPGSYSNNDDDGNEDVKTLIGLISQTTNLVLAARVWYISILFLPPPGSLHDKDVEFIYSILFGGRR